MWSGLGLDGVKKLGLSKPKDHHYLNGEGCPSEKVLFTEKWKKEYQEVIETFRVLGVEETTIDEMLTTLAAILLLGDTTYKLGANDASEITSDPAKIETAAKHLGCDGVALRKALTTTSTETRGEVCMLRESIAMDSPSSVRLLTRKGTSLDALRRYSLDYCEKPKSRGCCCQSRCGGQGYLPASLWMDYWNL